MATLREYLDTRNIPLVRFAPLVGCSHVQLSRIINGSRSPSLRLALRIAEATGGEVQPDSFTVVSSGDKAA